MAFPFSGFLDGKAALRVGRENFAVGAFSGVTRIHLIEGFADSPGQWFPALLGFRFVSIL
jgi:hypothetical protein